MMTSFQQQQLLLNNLRKNNPNVPQMSPLNQPPLPMGQPAVPPLPTMGQSPMGIPPPPPPVGQPSMAHPIIGQPPILNQTPISKPINQMIMNQPGIPQPPLGLPPIPPVPLSIRGDLMPAEESMEMDQHEDCMDHEPESEPPAPGTEEPPMEEQAPTPNVPERDRRS